MTPSMTGATRTSISFCPTTERDLADGIGPARELARVGCPLTLGSDSQAVIDLLEEARRVELGDEGGRRQRIGCLQTAGIASLSPT